MKGAGTHLITFLYSDHTMSKAVQTIDLFHELQQWNFKSSFPQHESTGRTLYGTKQVFFYQTLEDLSHEMSGNRKACSNFFHTYITFFILHECNKQQTSHRIPKRFGKDHVILLNCNKSIFSHP